MTGVELEANPPHFLHLHHHNHHQADLVTERKDLTMGKHCLKSVVFICAFSLLGLLACDDGEKMVFTSCNDGVLDGRETDVDCGGPTCDPCGIGRICERNSDCESGSCEDGLCFGDVPESCEDGLKNGSETDLDCGGEECTACGLGLVCEVNADCASGRCDAGVCVEGNLCGNGDLDFGETCDGDCPVSCNDNDFCTVDTLTGSADECTAECQYESVVSCTDGDGCCPAGCEETNDNDCESGFALRLNAGLETGMSSFDGKDFEALSPYIVSGSANSSTHYGDGIPIGGTVFDGLYQLELYLPDEGSPVVFDMPVENGVYEVHLHFVDWTPLTSEVGDRVFQVDIQGERVLTDFDIIAEAGKNTAIVKSFDVSVEAGSIVVTITNSVFFAEIAAIEILSPGVPCLGEGEFHVTTEVLPSGTVGVGYSSYIDTLGGVPPYIWSIQSGDLPVGLGLEESTGEISGTPSEEGTASFIVTVTDSNAKVATKELSLEILPGGSGEMSVALIWEDQYGPNTGWTCQTSDGYGQFLGGVVRDFPNMGVSRVNTWYEVEEAGDGSSCSLSINQATNTRVEIGTLRGWVLYADGSWVQYTNSRIHDGTHMPNVNDPFYVPGQFRGCGANPIFENTRSAHLGYDAVDPNETANGFRTYKSNYYWVWHGWGTNIYTLQGLTRAVYVQAYMRLVVENPDLPDDRHLANYVAHIASDTKNAEGVTLGDIGISRYKRITNEWQSFNFLTGGITREELESNPPPFSTVP